VNIWIPGEFTTLNEYIAAVNANRYKGAAIKKVETNRVAWECRGIRPIERYPVNIAVTWIRKDRKTDPDNCDFSIKFILDGLQLAGVLAQDTWKNISCTSHRHRIDKDNPGVSIEITEGELNDNLLDFRPFLAKVYI
jgi:hypothetical protein